MSLERRDVFTTIFRERRWGGTSVSGPGSGLNVTARIRSWLPGVFTRYNIESLIDAPCGDGIWIAELLPNLKSYLGVDIVPDLIADASARNIHPHAHYQIGDIIDATLPKADAIFCRDCIVHLSLDEGMAALKNIQSSGARYLIATTFPTRENVEHKRPGAWRPLNLEKPPFTLERTIELFYERMPNRSDQYNDKALGIWSLDAML
jgi:hypothetical protein